MTAQSFAVQSLSVAYGLRGVDAYHLISQNPIQPVVMQAYHPPQTLQKEAPILASW